MNLNKTIIGLAMIASTQCVLAAEPAPVIDASSSAIGSQSDEVARLKRQIEARNRAAANNLVNLMSYKTKSMNFVG